MLDLVYIVLWSVALACLVGGSLFLGIYGSGSLLFALRLAGLLVLRLAGLLVRKRHLSLLLPGILERGAFDQLLDGLLLLIHLLDIEPDTLAPLAEFGPAANIIGVDSQQLYT